MAAPICVSAKCNVTAIFDPALKAAVQKQIATSLKAAVAKSSKLKWSDSPCQDGWLLTVTLSLKDDGKTPPASLEAKVSIDGLLVGGTARAFKATGNAKATSINAKKLEAEAKLITGDVVEDASKKAVTEMSK